MSDWRARSWRVDETSIRVDGTWCYLYRAITVGGQTLEFYLSPKRTAVAAKRFLAKALQSNTAAGSPRVISTDKAPSLARAIAELKKQGICPRAQTRPTRATHLLRPDELTRPEYQTTRPTCQTRIMMTSS